jgi:hypothetical protein
MLHKIKGVNKKIPALKDKNLCRENISCISAQKGVAFFG